MSEIEDSRAFVFLDRRGNRWPRLRRLLLLGSLLLFVAFVLFVQSLFVKPELRLPSSVRTLKGKLKALQQESQKAQPDHVATWVKFKASPTNQDRAAKLRDQARPHPVRNFSEVRLGMYPNFDEDAYSELEAHGNSLTHLCPESMTLMDGSGALTIEEDPRVEKLAASKGIILMPLLNNISQDKWMPEAVEYLANGPESGRKTFLANLMKHLNDLKAGGVVIDWEQLDPTYRKSLTDLLVEIADELGKANMKLWLEVPMGDDFKVFDLERLSDSVDHFVAMLCDENSELDAPGPLASQGWFEGWVEVIKDVGEPEQWIATIGARGYDWTAGKPKAESISFQDAMSRASYAGIAAATVKAPSYNPSYSYQEPEGNHTVWFLDAITFLNQLRTAREAKLGGIAIDRLGTGDQQIWDVLSIGNLAALPDSAISHFEKLKASDTVTNVGQGEMVTVDLSRDDGARKVVAEPGGRLTASYTDFPTYPILYHQGAGNDHEVALTFDDGPDPKWTPKVLDILKERGIKAAFFLVGSQAEDYPGLVRRIVEEGHEIGNHTYTHANLAAISDLQIEIELNATQLLIESITGRSTTLFRPPYAADSRPNSLAELKPLSLVQDKLGYLVVLENIDPEDWSKPGADVILDRIKQQRSSGSIILLHDAGGNRSQTVEALPRIIDYLQTRGDQIVPLSDLLQIPKDDVMPLVTRGSGSLGRVVSGIGFRIVHATESFCWAFMIAATVLIVLRTLLVAILAFRHHHHSKELPVGSYAPPLSIIIAAYNEAKVITATLRSVLDTDYTGMFEVIVVDDGSSDGTADEVRRAAFLDKRIRLATQVKMVRQRLCGTGWRSRAAKSSCSSTRIHTLSVRHLRSSSALSKTPALARRPGHAKVGNLRTFIARCQSLEYICGFNLDRRAYDEWNCITVAPGAVSALRKPALEAAGGFCVDTLAEDTDLTLSLHRHGYRVVYVPDAVAWTEAPETIRALAKQRFRWAFGTLQCLWKHRDMMFNPQFKALAWFSLPSIWFFQILLVAITPIVDNFLIFSLILGGGGAMWSYFITFLLMDLALAMIACRLDGVKLRQAWTILPMRLLYRPLLSWVIWRAIIKAVKGAWVTWGKLERTASIEVRAA